ncbi:hypothetical protein VTN31DRAFT_1470 [Thermomyces dupontii]|uniref:uncharacterized protein n=1 Tax=Talaromyces thermophilus TaxID=28565 RepID=UPI0037429C4A
MTTTHTTAPTQTVPATSQIYIYGQPSPSNTPANNSPTSPRLTNAALHQLPHQTRQIRPPKAPLYVPAALRPTITPPRSAHGSLDSLNNDDSTPAPRKMSIGSAKTSVSKLAEDTWMKVEQLGEVTGAPTRDHWKADSASQTCDSPTCRSSFGLFVRRHHCRHCGHIFCSAHTPFTIPLDQDARFHPEGTMSRACDQCYKAYLRWEEARAANLSRIQSMLDAGELNIDQQNSPESSSDQQQDDSLSPSNRQSDPIASSVPRDWSWSTF